jgi:hypothetical protein
MRWRVQESMYRLLVVVVGLLAAACVTEPETACNAGEFPAVCTTIRGIVADPSGAPLQGFNVGPRYSVEECVCTTVYGQTDGEGRYSFRIGRVVGVSPEESWPDTLALFVAVGHPAEGWIDSVRASVVFGPADIVHEVDIVLDR